MWSKDNALNTCFITGSYSLEDGGVLALKLMFFLFFLLNGSGGKTTL